MTRILLVHGAFSDASVWDRVMPSLRGSGHAVDAIDLPGAGADRTPLDAVTLDAYADKICAVIATGPPALLVGHSMGGMAVTQAAARQPGRVAGLIYVAAFLPAPGQSLLALTELPEGAGEQVQANLVVIGDPPVATLPPDAAREARFGCCDDQQAAWGLARLHPQAVAPFTAPFELDRSNRDAYAALQRAYVVCTRDRAIPPALQRRMLAAAGCDPVIELDTDHCPWASCPGQLAEALNLISTTSGA
jgi:pimeloyl-ACP methyl ester carboxylesterase